MGSYCDSSTAPTLLNANVPTAQTTIDASTNFTCIAGYSSTGGNTLPYYLCAHNTNTTGLWSSVTYSCDSMH